MPLTPALWNKETERFEVHDAQSGALLGWHNTDRALALEKARVAFSSQPTERDAKFVTEAGPPQSTPMKKQADANWRNKCEAPGSREPSKNKRKEVDAFLRDMRRRWLHGNQPLWGTEASHNKRRRFIGYSKPKQLRLWRLWREPHTRAALERARDHRWLWTQLAITLVDCNPKVKPRALLRTDKQQAADTKEIVRHLREVLRLEHKIVSSLGISATAETLDEWARKETETKVLRDASPRACITRALAIYTSDLMPSLRNLTWRTSSDRLDNHGENKSERIIWGLPETIHRRDVAQRGRDTASGPTARALFRLRLQTTIPEDEYDRYVAAWLRCVGFENIESNWVRGVRLKGKT